MSNETFFVDKLLDGLSDRLRTFAESVRIVGEPITYGDKIIIPVISVNTGFAGAGGGGKKGEKGNEAASLGGGGAGIRITPQGFLVITESDVQLLSFSQKTRMESLIKTIPDIMEKVKSIRDSEKNKE